MSFSKSFGQCTKCVTRVHMRQQHTGSTVDPQKMQAKSVVLSQWKLVSQLKEYLSKISADKTFENAINKEFAHFLQRIQPSVYGSELVRYFENLTVTPTNRDKNEQSNNQQLEKPVEKPSESTSISSVFSGLKFKYGDSEVEKKKAAPKWMEACKQAVSKESVSSRTRHILSVLTETESEDAKLCLIEDLNGHLIKFPEAKYVACKEGAIRIIMRTKRSAKSSELKGVANESLSLLGYTNPVAGRGVRILTIDGGGVRGILVIEMLKKLEELTGQPVHQMFDLICGVSTGAIIAALIGAKQSSLDEIHDIYTTLSTQIFNQSALKGTSNLVWSHSYYDTALWEKLLKDQMGEQMLITTNRNFKSPKMCAVSAVVNQHKLSAYVFRNYSFPCRVQSNYIGSHNHKIWEAVRASAAAPTYFEECKLGNMLHQDGGILINNPTAVAIHEAKLLWPRSSIQCVISFGTGRSIPLPADMDSQNGAAVNGSSWKNKFYALIESATDTEGVHTMLNDLLPDNVYYRFNPYLTEMLNMAEIDPVKLEQLKRDAVMYLRRNEDKFQEAAKNLNIQKSPTQKVVDWLSLQSLIHGLHY